MQKSIQRIGQKEDGRYSMEVRAYAKINLGLDVTGRREDGYHLVRMIMQALELHDTLYLEESGTPGVQLETGDPDVPAGRDNLIVRAGEKMLDTFAPGKGVRIRLEKCIPMAAGLAGGSTDAAAAMRGMNELFGLNQSDEELRRLGVQLGADIPYCILGGTALAEGIGEVLTALPALPGCYLVLGKPAGGLSTPEMYRGLDAETDVRHPDIDGQIRALREGDLFGVAERLGNVLEPVACARQPEVGIIREQMLEAGAIGARMSGSGPTVFGIFTEEEKAKKACSVLEKGPAKEVILTAPIQNGRNA